MKTARAMMLGGGVNVGLWDEAVKTACIVKNRSPVQGMARTPWEALTGYKPCVSRFRTYGCPAYVLRPEHEQESKLAARSVKGQFVGYELDGQAWRILVNNRVVVSRNVTFNEWGFFASGGGGGAWMEAAGGDGSSGGGGGGGSMPLGGGVPAAGGMPAASGGGSMPLGGGVPAAGGMPAAGGGSMPLGGGVPAAGGMPAASGARYVTSFIDVHSGAAVVRFVKRKSDIPEVVKGVIAKLETQLGRKLLQLQSDRGGEFLNAELGGYLEQRGIQHSFSAPYSPQQNGAAERLNRTLMKTARAMMLGGGVNVGLWDEAVKTACIVKNRSPVQGMARTPWEALTGYKPCVSRFRTYGCPAYVLRPEHEQESKLAARSVKGQFVGYELDGQAWRILVNNRVVVSRNVTFNEWGFFASGGGGGAWMEAAGGDGSSGGGGGGGSMPLGGGVPAAGGIC
ncbi:Retrovirus-related Pol polyprotein from transposon [Tetrabaena socialis]|uniref:Retrovirus-related Pol polyprotein from transposon n=1 Tax=Tetrabaena socialis TaxID=47790 RepID=A0A2J8A1G3_9CHLO|nr:Retrovirus-related Pol polyprotein from transposon [Tetrabaena socialis]|eukprot:PNH06354.1 Retrovirus-related Pol polyprotein from transposon [Tetrabaena socialis]